ncbi:MAG: DUF1778 domain-containing protein [Terriglobia bacterium]|jgi:uncharacterized protein (DUF1778 family)
MKTAPVNKKNRTRRLNLRATEHQERLIRTGAQTRGVSVTDFILESACLQAEHALADKREFIVSSKQRQAFLEALDRPAHVNPKLAQLFSNPIVLPRASNR